MSDNGSQPCSEERSRSVENVIIVGGGPAGYTAALYTGRADLEPLVVEGFMWGGLLQQTTDVENFPGYPKGVLGPELMQQLRDQAERFGTRFITEDASAVELSRDGGPHRVVVGARELWTRALILATGAEPKRLAVPGEEELAARGVSYCATCDAAFFRGQETIVVGGGDTAMEDATFLAKFASKVTIIHRRDEFRASAIMVDRARETENIEFLTPYVVERLDAGDDGSLARTVLKHTGDGSEKTLEIDGAFVAIGHRPNSDLVAGQVEIGDDGYVEVQGRSTRTSVPGVFAAGDLTDRAYRQAVTAAASGCMAALDAEGYLRDYPPDAASSRSTSPANENARAVASV